MRTRSGLISALLALATFAAVGCTKNAETPAKPGAVHAAKPVSASAAKPSASAAKPNIDRGDAATPSKAGPSDRACVGAIDIGVAKDLTLAGRKATVNGYRLTFTDKPQGDAAVFGVLASINEDTPENLFNLQRYIAWFKAQKAQAIIVDGDTGDSEGSIAHSLTLLAESGLPVLVEVGNHECKSDFSDAVIAVQKKADNIVNLDTIREVDFGHATVLSLPGYHDPQFVHCPDSPCIYTAGDVKALEPLARQAKAPVVLVVHGPPHGTTPNAIDAIEGGKNIGDPNLNALITSGKIAFGVFGNVKEAGGRATDLTGQNVIKEGAFASALYLGAGPADSVPWTMNDGTTSNGMAQLLTVKGDQASYQVYRVKPLTAAEEADAAKLKAKLAPTATADADKAPEKAAK